MIRQPVQRTLYLAGLILISLGMLFSGPVASMSMMLIGVNWFTELHYRERLQAFFRNIPAVLLTSVFFLHLLGLLWTTDFDYGWNDIRIKIPLLILPFFVS